MSNPLRDMEKPDVIFCIGTNMTECHPVAATRLKKAIRNEGSTTVSRTEHDKRIDYVEYAATDLEQIKDTTGDPLRERLARPALQAG